MTHGDANENDDVLACASTAAFDRHLRSMNKLVVSLFGTSYSTVADTASMSGAIFGNDIESISRRVVKPR